MRESRDCFWPGNTGSAALNDKMPISRTQIDRLGDRLKRGPHTESDLRLLEEYRQSFGESYESVLRTLRDRGVAPTGRVAKSTPSIVAKLRRESLRLSQMQDIAGCRVIVRTIEHQDELLAFLTANFPEAAVLDRREKSSHGYRAVHIIPEVCGKPVEIQVRTSLQHLWAELSEKSADVLDPMIKYGGGPDSWLTVLTEASEALGVYELLRKDYTRLLASQDAMNAKYEKIMREMTEGTGDDQLHDAKDSKVTKMEEWLMNQNEAEEMLRDLRVRLEQASDAFVRVFQEAATGLDKIKGHHR
jgi:putative GTP pyrophosphokinase